MANLTIKERLLHYFLAMGLEYTLRTETPENVINLESGADHVCVLALSDQDALQSSKVIGAILTARTLQESSQLVYLAVPRLLGTSIDVATFRAHGIGLLLYDERRIDEALAAQPAKSGNQQSQADEKLDPAVLAELTTLRSMYSTMERTIAQLRDDFRALQHESETRLPPIGRIHPDIMRTGEGFNAPNASSGTLPSFFANNPWLDLLSKRGRAEEEPIAG